MWLQILRKQIAKKKKQKQKQKQTNKQKKPPPKQNMKPVLFI